jgi:hypothetical protein
MFIFVVAAYLVVPYLARFFLCVVLYALAILLFFLQVSSQIRVLIAEKKFDIFLIKNCNFLIPRPP